MFKVDLSATYLWPVKVRVPGEKKGKFETFSFFAEFKRVDQDRIKQMLQELRAQGDAPEGSVELTDRRLLDEVLVGWKDVTDASGKPLEFNDETLDAVLAVGGMEGAFVASWFDAINGSGAILKN